MEFVKAHCGGNDFIIIDARKEKIPDDLQSFVKKICKRKVGIGADSVVIIENTKEADLFFRYFNPDGSEYGVCGNGALSTLFYIGKNKIKFQTSAGIFLAEIAADKVKIKMPKPKEIKLNIFIEVDGNQQKIHFVDIGVPHSIIFTNNVSSINMEKAKKIRYHEYFQPYGTNINFVELINKNKIKVRTYEKGVEDETLSCGSGLTSSAIVSFLLKKISSPVEIITIGGVFNVYINKLNDIWLEGSPVIIYKGEINYT